MPHMRINGLLLFLVSVLLPPGANYMYMGLIKRGLAAMCGFFLLAYLMITNSAYSSAALFLGISIFIFWITCIFDGFSIRRRINNGETVEDGIGKILNSILSNKKLTFAVLVILVLAFAGNIAGAAFGILRRVLPLAFVALVLYIIFRKK